MSSNLDFSTMIKNDLKEYFISNRAELTREDEFPEVEEAPDIDIASLEDIDLELRGKKNVKFFEGKDKDLRQGIKIETGTLNGILGENTFGAIDGSSAKINRSLLSPIIARAAFGSYSHNSKLPMHEITKCSVSYLISHEQIVKKMAERKIYKIRGSKAKEETLSLQSGQLQAQTEIDSISFVMDKYKGLIDYLIIDGPLYFPHLMNTALSAVKYAIAGGSKPFSIVKRSQDDTLSQFIRSRIKEAPLLKPMSPWVHTDRELLQIFLPPGRRTPFYTYANSYELKQNINESMQRVCTWIKLPSGRTCRIEIPRCIAMENDSLDKANEIVRMVYKMSLENQGRLPLCLERADRRALLSYNDTKKYQTQVDQYLRSLNLYSGNPDNWKE